MTERRAEATPGGYTTRSCRPPAESCVMTTDPTSPAPRDATDSAGTFPTTAAAGPRRRLHKGERLELAITTLAFGGQGIGRLDNFVVFVDGAVPGDVAEVAVTRVKRSFAEARLERLLTPSPDRRDATCRHFGSCGGCRWQSLDYEVQLRYKELQVRDSLERLGNLDGFELRPIKGMPDPWRYRNKVEFSIAAVEGRLAIGFHPPGRWDAVLPLTECHLVPVETEAVRATVETWLRDVGRRAVECARPDRVRAPPHGPRGRGDGRDPSQPGHRPGRTAATG